MRRRGSVRPSADDSSAGVWNRDDMHALQRSIDPLQRKLKLRPVMGWLRSPEISSMLCGPPDTIFQRLEGFLSVINIMSGLLLSAIGGSALNPIKVADLPEDVQPIGNVYNVMITFAVVVQACVACYSSYALMVLYGIGNRPELVYRYITHFHLHFSLCEFGTYLPGLTFIGIVPLQAFLNCTGIFRWVAQGVVVVAYLVYHVTFAENIGYASPSSLFGWIFIVAPYKLPFIGRLRADAKRIGKVQMDAAATGVLLGKDRTQDMIIDDESVAEVREASAEEKVVASWAADAVPELAGVRAEKLGRVLVAQGLTPERLQAFARLRSADAMAMLSVLEKVEMTKGERLALATAVLRQAEEEGAGSVSVVR